MMTDVRRPAGAPARPGAERPLSVRRGVLRRAGKWCAAVLAASAALTLGAGPVPATAAPRTGTPQPYWGTDRPQSPATLIKPGSSAPVTFGIKKTGNLPSRVDKLTLAVYSPELMRLADTKVTPVGTAPGGWSCRMFHGMTPMEHNGTHMICTSSYSGPPPAEEWHWKVNIAAPAELPAGTRSANGWAALRLHSPDRDRDTWWDSNSMSLEARTPAP
ncbi:hypothetical protein J2Z21_006123 [Streptomyces griseochromogenes]|uniref:Uncharacterized protein n=1 Tax=Streptomyces griseochromogenes TaxID=68214 RepID=A0A1B1ASA4_9ACTN|nr:hypothetical protein [Streptomyces griseochromogenes]ANP49436.1 hypothetical protein AVL59_07340 [Streptomyces griseochromogenes]MBP2053132.1 hypothetical protein [Streptomyces griseochromogenes]